jgi:hypothetical protein
MNARQLLTSPFLEALSAEIATIGFPAIDVAGALEADGDLVERSEVNGITTRLALFPSFAQISYTFAGEDRPGPRFSHPGPEAGADDIADAAATIVSHLLTRDQAEEHDPTLKRERLAHEAASAAA